jgi:hypothetical protein
MKHGMGWETFLTAKNGSVVKKSHGSAPYAEVEAR